MSRHWDSISGFGQATRGKDSGFRVPSPDIRVIVSLPKVPPPVRFPDLHPAGRLHGNCAVDEEEGPLDLHTCLYYLKSQIQTLPTECEEAFDPSLMRWR